MRFFFFLIRNQSKIIIRSAAVVARNGFHWSSLFVRGRQQLSRNVFATVAACCNRKTPWQFGPITSVVYTKQHWYWFSRRALSWIHGVFKSFSFTYWTAASIIVFVTRSEAWVLSWPQFPWRTFGSRIRPFPGLRSFPPSVVSRRQWSAFKEYHSRTRPCPTSRYRNWNVHGSRVSFPIHLLGKNAEPQSFTTQPAKAPPGARQETKTLLDWQKHVLLLPSS